MREEESKYLENDERFQELDIEIMYALSCPKQDKLYTQIPNTTVDGVAEHIKERCPDSIIYDMNLLELESIKKSYVPEFTTVGEEHVGLPQDPNNIPLIFIPSKLNTIYLIPLIDEDTLDVKVSGRTLENSAIAIKTIYKLLQRIDNHAENLKFSDLDSQIKDILSMNQKGELEISLRGFSIEDVSNHIKENFPTSTQRVVSSGEKEEEQEDGLLCHITSKWNALYLFARIDEESGEVRINGAALENKVANSTSK